jgi:hypothetical protein
MGFKERFSDEEICRKTLMKLRLKNGFVCPRCGGTRCFSIATRGTVQCTGCQYQMSATAGTVMDRTHIPLQKWFWALYLVSMDKRGCSAMQLSRELVLPYNTAWFLLQRIRKAMTDWENRYLLEGIVQMDDAYIGSPKKGGKRGRGTKKAKFIAALSTDEEGHPRYLKIRVVPNLKGKTVKQFAAGSIQKGAQISTDAYCSYRKPLAEGYGHDFSVFDPSDSSLKWLHTIISNAKAFVQGTYHGLGEKHLQRYFDEFCYRFNRRYMQGCIFDRLLLAAALLPLFVFLS